MSLIEIEFNKVRMVTLHDLTISVLLESDVTMEFRYETEDQLQKTLSAWLKTKPPAKNLQIDTLPPMNFRQQGT